LAILQVDEDVFEEARELTKHMEKPLYEEAKKMINAAMS
jgi:HEPN domain-containing protein